MVEGAVFEIIGGARTMSRTGLGIELMFLRLGLGDQDVFINEAIARGWFAIQDVGRGVNYLQDMSSFYT